MGALSGCFQAHNPGDDQSVDDGDDVVNHGRCCDLFKKFAELFRGERLQMQVVPPESPAIADLLRDNAAVNNTTNSPTTLRIETNNLQQVAVGVGDEDDGKQPTDGDDSDREYFDEEDLNQLHSDEELEQNLLKLSPDKAEIKYVDLSFEDEDLCAICLEEFSPENPVTVLQCTHCYHLGCTYEWMERSPNCPICEQVMLFDETILK
ncbi:E3 ubiquitin-protein ligase SIRP1-like [Tripterygium wilfordii]|uniref:E3 ubiquitin-protein ligase SIRP1-like n=1 Tax=Tripterygium wilfordii TaxID=458696 RepID=UPI0018F7F2D1|nr:E3 ubiquitin-protein ligase SIRP1-like [Tripterygium wilfordii]